MYGRVTTIVTLGVAGVVVVLEVGAVAELADGVVRTSEVVGIAEEEVGEGAGEVVATDVHSQVSGSCVQVKPCSQEQATAHSDVQSQVVASCVQTKTDAQEQVPAHSQPSFPELTMNSSGHCKGADAFSRQ